MPIIATCSTCGHQYTLNSKLAGKKVRCKRCSGVVDVPAHSPVSPVPTSLAPVISEDRDGSYDLSAPIAAPIAPAITPTVQVVAYRPEAEYDPSQERLTAGRTCVIIAVLGYFCSSCVGLSSLFIFLGSAALIQEAGFGAAAAGHVAVAGVIVGVVFFVSLGISTTYLLCGMKIRQGNRPAVLVALVLASIHGVLSLATISLPLITILQGRSPNVVGMLINLLWIAALAQLILQLTKILREPR